MITTRRRFVKAAGLLSLALPLAGNAARTLFSGEPTKATEVDAHLWVYASRYPPDWDCTPILNEVFSDLSATGYSGVELMDSILRHDGSVERLKELSEKYAIPVSGSSYQADMWRKEEKQKILDDLGSVLEKLHSVGGKTLGITVGDANRRKTEAELDAQADLLKSLMPICEKFHIVPNLHNHTFEVKDDLYDLRGTMKRVPEMKLGPDLNWLVRAGVDPVWFIRNFGHKIVYMHIRDQDAHGVWSSSVGEGVTNFPAIARELRSMNYRGRAAVELAFDKAPDKPVRECWRDSRNYVKKVFGW